MILGTAAYMSPEQAKGKPADKRSDIWAFGFVLYEMLTGKPAFDGEHVSETLTAVLRSDPDWTALPRGCPPNVRDVLESCLEKDRKQRIPDISAVSFLLYRGLTSSTIVPAPAQRVTAALVIAGALALAGIAAYGAWVLKPSPAPHVARFFTSVSGSSSLAVGSPFPDVIVSLDGLWIAYSVGGGGGVGQLMVRRVDQLDATPLRSAASGPTSPFFSPDGRWIGFGTPGELWKVPIAGGATVRIAAGITSGLRGAAWGTAGTIVFGTNDATGLQRVSASAT
jgi:serine/threonine-protein kinase